MATNRTSELLPGTLDMMILKTLSFGPNHGYGIARRIRRTTEEVLHVEEGSLYPALHRLEKRGYLASEWRRSESNRRAKYYRLTKKGRARLKVEQRAWTQLATAIEKVMSAQSRTAPSAGLVG